MINKTFLKLKWFTHFVVILQIYFVGMARLNSASALSSYTLNEKFAIIV